MDPCDLRLQARRRRALRDLVARRTPLFEFAIRTTLAEHDLDNAEGRVGALRQCVSRWWPRSRIPTLRDEYARQLAGWVGWDDVAQVIGRVREEAGPANPVPAVPAGHRGAPATSRAAVAERPNPRDPVLWSQREALKAALQYPALAARCSTLLSAESFTHPGYVAVRAAIETAGGTLIGDDRRAVDRTGPRPCGDPGGRRTDQRAGCETIKVDDEERLPRYIGGVLARLQEVWVGRQIAEVKSKLQRMSPVEQGDEYHALFGDLVALEAHRRSLLEQASGG